MHNLNYLRWAFLTSLATAKTLAANERERVAFGARGLSRERHAPALQAKVDSSLTAVGLWPRAMLTEGSRQLVRPRKRAQRQNPTVIRLA
jgi:hypothetical protein